MHLLYATQDNVYSIILSVDGEGMLMFTATCIVLSLYLWHLQIYRVKTKWKLQLKDGIMNISGHEYVFHKCLGEADW